MKTKSHYYLLILSLALVLLFTGAAKAQTDEPAPPGPGGEPSEAQVDRINNMLRLTGDQKKKMQEIRFKYSAKMEDITFSLQRKRFELAEILRQNDPDRKKIDAKVDQLMNLEKQRHRLILDEYFEIRKILNKRQNSFFLRRIIRAMMKQH